MNRAIRFMTRVDIGFYLLLMASALLFSGAIVTDFNSDLLRKLNFITFQRWFPEHYMYPLLYVWIALLFAVLFLLAVNTLLCTIVYVKNTLISWISARKWAIVMFHICFLIFLSGHFIYGFTGESEKAIAERGISTDLPTVGLSIVPLSVEKRVATVYGKDIPMATEATITVTDGGERRKTIHPATLRPKCAFGYSFHLSMNEKNLGDSQISIIVRKGYAPHLFALGGIVAVIAILLYIPSLLRPHGAWLSRLSRCK